MISGEKRLFRHRGSALIIALLVAALAAVTAVTLITSEQRWLASVDAQRDHAQAQALADAGVHFARHLLFQDTRLTGGMVVHLKGSWAFPLPPTPFENGFIEGQIIDMQGRFNLNSLLTAKRAEVERLERLFRQLGLDSKVRQTLFSHYNAHTLSGGDRSPPSGASAQQPLFDLGDLALPVAVVGKLTPYLAVLPEPTTLNVNTADRDVLKAVFADLNDDDVNRLLEERDKQPFSTMGDFRRRSQLGTKVTTEEGLGVASNYFLVTVRARQGGARAQAQALLHRSDKHWPEIVWKTVE